MAKQFEGFITAPATPEFLLRAKVTASLLGISRSELVRRAMREFMDKPEVKKLAKANLDIIKKA